MLFPWPAPRPSRVKSRHRPPLRQRLDGERDALAAADAQRDDAALEAVAPHRVNEARREHRAGGADGMAVRDRAALDVDDVLGQPELAGDSDDDRREGLVDLDALDLAERPAGARERLAHRRDRT